MILLVWQKSQSVIAQRHPPDDRRSRTFGEHLVHRKYESKALQAEHIAFCLLIDECYPKSILSLFPVFID